MPLTTERVLSIFREISAIPRCSGNEKALVAWLQRWAKQRRFDYRKDATGNLVIRVPAAVGCENAPSVVLQGHLDMVCEKRPDVDHDFSADAIPIVEDGEWICAEGTTLGADNGIGVAIALALAEDETGLHPALELLMTVDEETGLTGAKNLDASLIRGRHLINLDSEEDGAFTVGCAGGVDTNLTRRFDQTPVPAGYPCYKLAISGLSGGHSGVDIHRQRGCANRLLARMLNDLCQAGDMRLVSISGGSRKNAIARDAEALFAIAPETEPSLETRMALLTESFRQELATTDPNLQTRWQPMTGCQQTDPALSRADTQSLVQLLMALPHGVAGRSMEILELVETSSNLATCTLKSGHLKIVSSQRSARPSRLKEITAIVHAVAELAGAECRDHSAYPPWPISAEAPLTSACRQVYRDLYQKEPVISAVHAGLECAVIGEKIAGMQMISLGPTIVDAHSPDERLHLGSLEKICDYMQALLPVLAKASGHERK